MIAVTLLATLRRAAQAPALAGIYIKSVALSAPYAPDQPLMLAITWSMPDTSAAIDNDGLSLPGVRATMLSRPADSLILLDRALASPGEIEDEIMSAAWSMGAWDLVRLERPRLADGADWRDLRHGVAGDFGCGHYLVAGHPTAQGDSAPGAAEHAASHGYVSWRFVPLAAAAPMMRRKWADKDRTLQPDCTRVGEPAHHRARWVHPTEPGRVYEHQYKLGRANHGNRSKLSQERRA